MNIKIVYIYLIFAICCLNGMEDVQLTIENSTNILWQSITVSTLFDTFTQNGVSPNATFHFNFLTKTNAICVIRIQIVPTLTTIVPQHFQSFTIQICGNTSIKISSSNNIFGIARPFIILNKTDQTLNALINNVIQLILPKSLCMFNIFTPLHLIEQKPMIIGTCCYQKEAGVYKNINLEAYLPLHGDHYEFTIP